MTLYLVYYYYYTIQQEEIDDIDEGVSIAFWMIEQNTGSPYQIINENETVIKTRDDLDDLMNDYYYKHYG